MATIKCPECGKEISDRAKNCPECGYPLKKESTSIKYDIAAIVLSLLGILILYLSFTTPVKIVAFVLFAISAYFCVEKGESKIGYIGLAVSAYGVLSILIGVVMHILL